MGIILWSYLAAVLAIVQNILHNLVTSEIIERTSSNDF